MSFQSIRTDDNGLCVESDVMKADSTGVTFKRKHYKWKPDYTHPSALSDEITQINGHLYINKKHWSDFVEAPEYPEEDDSQNSLIAKSVALCLLILLTLCIFLFE